MKAIVSNKYFWFVVIALAVIAAVYLYSAKLQEEQDENSKVDYPTGGAGIPPTWSPDPTVQALYAAMAGPGTYEDDILDALNGLSKDQLAAVYNAFNAKYEGKTPWYDVGTPNGDLFAWFTSELSGTTLATVMNYFNGIH